MSINSRSKSLFKKFLGINTMLLKLGGTFDRRNSLKNPAGVITLVFLSLWILGEWYQVILHVDINREATIKSIGSILSGYLTTTKGLSLLFQSQNLDEILQRLTILWDNQYQVLKNRNVMLIMAKKVYRITYLYFISCSLFSIIFHLNPYKSFLYQYLWTKNENNTYNFSTIMQTEYPVDMSYLGNYLAVIIIEHIIVLYFLLYLVSSDTLYWQLFTHLCLHFKLLRSDLENIIDNLTLINISYEEKHKALEKLSKIVKRQNELYLLSRRVEKIFRPIFFVSMLVTSITICISVHQIQLTIVIGQFWQGFGQLSHSFILLAEVAIYCGCSSMLSHETELVATAAYNCPWPHLGKQFCSELQFLMLRAQKTFRCTAYGLFRVDLPQLTTIVSAAMTYFTLLNSLVKQK